MCTCTLNFLAIAAAPASRQHEEAFFSFIFILYCNFGIIWLFTQLMLPYGRLMQTQIKKRGDTSKFTKKVINYLKNGNILPITWLIYPHHLFFLPGKPIDVEKNIQYMASRNQDFYLLSLIPRVPASCWVSRLFKVRESGTSGRRYLGAADFWVVYK